MKTLLQLLLKTILFVGICSYSYAQCPTAANTTITVQDVTCNGDNNGIISLTFADGASPYTSPPYNYYLVRASDNQPITAPFGSVTVNVTGNTVAFNNIPPDVYYIQVAKANPGSCIVTFGFPLGSLEVKEPAVLAFTTDSKLDQTNCTVPNGAINITTTGGNIPYTYNWTGPDPDAPFATEDISGLIAGTYNLTITDNKGCSVSSSFTIDSPPLPTADAGSDVSICNGGSTTLTATGGVTYSWSPALGLSATNIASPIASPTVTTTYTVTVTDASNCTDTDEVTVAVNTLPTATLTGNNTICVGGSSNLTFALTGTAPWNLVYNDGSGNIAVNGIIASPHVISVNPAGTTTYNLVSVSDASCAGTTSGSAAITVTPSPLIFNVTGGGPYCQGGTGLPVGLDGSQSGVDYTLQRNGVNTTTIVAGTGAAISFGNITQAGTYTVIATTTGGTSCTAAMSGNVVVSITPLPILYSITGGGAYCAGGVGRVVGLSDTQVGVNYQLRLNGVNTGAPIVGTGSAISFGLQTAAGNYTIVATGTALPGCSRTMNGNRNVTINPLPTADAGSDGTICEGLSTNLSASGGVTYSWSPATGLSATNIANPTASPIVTTTYTVTVTSASGCSDTDDVIVTVTPSPDATITPAGPFCISSAATNLTSATAGGTWSGVGITDVTTGTFDPATAGAGTHTITYSVSVGGCTSTDTQDIIVNPLPDATIAIAGPFCISSTATNLVAATGGGTWSGVGITDATAGTFDPATAGIGTHSITYSVTVGGCTSTDTEDIVVNPLPDATITAAGPFCVSSAAVNLTSATNGGTWSGTGITDATAGTFDPATAGAGTHTITYSVTVGGCTSTDTQDIIVNPLPNATITATGPFCISSIATNLVAATAGGIWSGTGITDATAGTFDPATAGVGTHTIIYSVTIGGCTSTDTQDVIVNPLPDATITAAGPFCTNSTAINLTAATAGGTWSGVGITDATAGTFDPVTAGIGTHTITYSITVGGCTSTDTQDILVNPSPDATISAAGPFCTNSTAINLTAATVGGTWSGTGITNATAGTFDPATAGVGTHTITYSVTVGGCTSTDTQDIIVNPLPDATITAAGPFCISSVATNLVAATAGGSWSGVGITDATVGTFDPTTAGVGTHTITYSVTIGGCTSTDIQDIIVNPLPVATITAAGPFCISSAAINLTSATNGGTWSGTGITDATAGTFDPATAGVGTHTITYSVTVGGCTSTDTQDIIVNPAPNATITAAGPFCISSIATNLVAATPGGIWSGTGITDATTGNFDPAIAGVGTHTITYSVTVGGCTSTDTQDIIVNPLPDATIAGVGPFCTNSMAINLTAATVGGTWSGTGITNATAGTFDPATAGAGTHTITYSVTVGGCTSTDTQDIIVNPLPDATIAAVGPFCTNSTAINLTAATIGGTWSGLGITDAAAGTFDPVTAGAGTHTITYSVTVGGCTSTDTQDIIVNPLPDATITAAGPFCISSTTVNLTSATAGGTWSGTGITDATTGTFDPAVAGVGTHTITYSVTVGGCTSTDTQDIIINLTPNATITAAGPFCISSAAINLTSATAGGTWSGAGIADAIAGTFDPATAGVGTHTITYSVTVGGCTSTDTEDIIVNPLPNATITAAGPFCTSSAAVNLTSATNGGTWSGTGIIDAAAGTFDPATAGAGTHTITYSVTVGGCASTDTEDIIVNPLPDATITAAGPFCANSVAINLTAATVGGTWSGLGITDATAGTFDPAAAGVGTHTITYSVTVGGCTSTDTEDIIVNPLPDATITAAGPFCANSAAINLVAASAGGTWSGLGITDAAAGTFDPAIAGVGTHTITYSVTVGGCTSTDTQDIVINPLPIINAGADQLAVCGTSTSLNASTPALGESGQWSVLTGTGGTFADATLFNTTFDGLLDSTYTLIWNINNVTCSSQDTVTIGFKSLPDTVRANPATAVSCDSFIANWSPITAATSYSLEVSTDGFATLFYQNAAITDTAFTVTGLAINTLYEYRVKAENACGLSNVYSDTIQVNTLTTPNIPQSSIPTDIDCDEFTANWASVAGAMSYELDIVDSVGTLLTQITAITDTTFDVTGLLANKTYGYVVRAINACGASGNSQLQTLTTEPAMPLTPVVIAADSIECNGFIARWTSSVGATSYIINLTQSGVPVIGFTNLNTGNDTTLSIVGLNPSTLYEYEVTAINNCGTSAISGQQTVTTLASMPATPLVAAGTDISCMAFTANWNPASDASSYVIDVALDINFTSILPNYNNLNIGTDTILVINSAVAPGTNYFYRVRGINNCGTSLSSDTVTVLTLPIGSPGCMPPVCPTFAEAFQTPATCNGISDGEAVGLILDGSNVIYEYDIAIYNTLTGLFVPSGTFQSVPKFTGLDAGDSIKIFVRDANGTCGPLETPGIGIKTKLNFFAAVQITKASCIGTDGAITFDVFGGSGNYTYTLDDGIHTPQTDSIFTGVSDGTYTYTITDNTLGCLFSSTVVVGKSTISPKLSVTNPAPFCTGGTIPTVSVVGPNIQWYANSDKTGLIADSTNTFTPFLIASFEGDTTFYVTQTISGCAESEPKSVTFTSSQSVCGSGCDLSVSIKVKDQKPCNVTPSGSIIMTAKQGLAPYEYEIHLVGTPVGVFGNTNTFTVENGEYVTNVKDARGCIVTDTVTIELMLALQPSALGSTGTALCGGEDGKATVAVTGGSGVYSTSKDGGVTFTPGAIVTGLPLGVSMIMVRDDSTDCYATEKVTITGPVPLEILYETTPASCNNDDGTLKITEWKGGTAPYKFFLDGREFTMPEDSTLRVLDRGEKILKIEDANGCSVTETLRIEAPGLVILEPIFTPSTCEKFGMDGSIAIKVKAGSAPGPYELSINSSPFEPYDGLTREFNGLINNKEYVFTIRTVAEGCPNEYKFMLNGVDAVSFDLKAINVKCNGDNSGSIRITNIQGDYTAPFSVEATLGNNSVFKIDTVRISKLNNNYTIYNLFAGEGYSITVRQTAQCPDGLFERKEIDVNQPNTPLAATIGKISETLEMPVRTIGNGSIAIEDIIGGTWPYEIRIEGVDNYNSGIVRGFTAVKASSSTLRYDTLFANLPQGKYEITVKDANGCTLDLEAVVPYDENVFIPNVFTPNGDNHNENFYIRNLPAEGAKLTITNRWGKVVYYNGNYNESNLWNGGSMPDGVYFYRLELPGNEKASSFTGYVEVWRGQQDYK